MVDCDNNRTRFHRWNDFDRLTFSLGHDFCGYYGYDADGIRTYKLMGTCNISTQNGGGLQAQAIFDDMVLYPSPYMVVTPRGYTNHYYAGSERIASRVGNRCWSITPTDEWEKPSPEEEALQNFWNIGKEEYPFGEKSDYNSPTTNTTPINGYEEKVQYDCTPVELPEVDILHSTDMLGYTINCDYSYQNDAPVYYYHSDHLGSTSWVTDFKGNEHQFLAYLPYGEPLLDIPFDHYDSRYGMDSVRYKFTGKERDWETGYDYMEQRYYWWPGGFWLRHDPLLDKYLNLSPYAYCNGNPLKYVDPDGKEKQNWMKNNVNSTENELYECAENHHDDNHALILFAHSIRNPKNGYIMGLMNKDIGMSINDVADAITRSDYWQKGGGDKLIILFSCNTGSERPNSPSFGQRLSKILKQGKSDGDVYVVAPVGVVTTKRFWFFGKARFSNVLDNAYSKRTKYWQIYKNGEVVTDPNGNPIRIFGKTIPTSEIVKRLLQIDI